MVALAANASLIRAAGFDEYVSKPVRMGQVLTPLTGTSRLTRWFRWTLAWQGSVHEFHEVPIAGHHVIAHLLRRDIREESPRAFDLRLLDFPKLK